MKEAKMTKRDERLHNEYCFLQELKLWLREQDKQASARQREITKLLDDK